MKVGITIDLSSPFWSNGFNQYLVFLYESLEEVGCDCYYLSEEEPKFLPPKTHKGMVVKDLIADKSETFDVVVYGSFILDDDCIDMLYNRNRKIKFNLINYSNKIFDDISFSIYSREQKFIAARPKRLSSVWLNEEFSYQSSYVKTFYKVKNVKTTPFMWESCFIENEKKGHLFNDISPIFIIGLPRSGSTLVEAIITSSENNIPSFGESAFINMGVINQLSSKILLNPTILL